MPVYIVNLADFLGADGEFVRGAAGRMGAFYADIVATATVHLAGEVVRTPLRCRRRPGHRRCPGHLLVRHDDAGTVEWCCGMPDCDEEGLIRGWAGTPWDLRQFAARLAAADDRLALPLDEEEYRAGLAGRSPGGEAEALLRAAVYTPTGIVLQASSRHLHALRDELERQAGNARPGGRRTTLRRLCRKLEQLLAVPVSAPLRPGAAGRAGVRGEAPPVSAPGAEPVPTPRAAGELHLVYSRTSAEAPGLRTAVRAPGRSRVRAAARGPTLPAPIGLPTWAEVDLRRIRDNVAALRARLRPGCRLVAVVKAEAYGHGAVPVARAALEAGAELLGVARLDEGLALRAGGVAAPVLVLGWTPRDRAAEVVAAGLHQAVFDPGDAAALARAGQALGRRALLHAKVDTGMGRLGWPCRTAADAERTAAEVAALARLPGAELVGVFTHFAEADAPDLTRARAQLVAFARLLAALESAGVRPALRHCASTAALLRLPEAQLDACRTGLGMYGYLPSPDVPDPGLRPALSWYARVAQVRTLRPGETVSYGGTYAARGTERVAALAVGYADGFPRCLSNRGTVLVNDRAAPVRGRVCMDQVVVGVDGCGQVRQGTPAVLIGEGHWADALAAEAGTIAYESLCAIGPRVPRLYVGS